MWNGLTDRFTGTRADHRVTFDRHFPNRDPDTANPRQNLARKMGEMAARIARTTKGDACHRETCARYEIKSMEFPVG